MRIASAPSSCALLESACAAGMDISPTWKRIDGLLDAGNLSTAALHAARISSRSLAVRDGHSAVDPPRRITSTPLSAERDAYASMSAGSVLMEKFPG